MSVSGTDSIRFGALIVAYVVVLFRKNDEPRNIASADRIKTSSYQGLFFFSSSRHFSSIFIRVGSILSNSSFNLLSSSVGFVEYPFPSGIGENEVYGGGN